MKRSLAREQAFILVFEKSFRDDSIDEIIAAAADARELVDDSFARECAVGVYENIGALDDKISAASTGWSITRISRVALSIMRLAVYEMLYIDNIPVSVSINEAVELAKKYGGSDDSAFVNGVLGAIAKTVDEQ